MSQVRILSARLAEISTSRVPLRRHVGRDPRSVPACRGVGAGRLPVRRQAVLPDAVAFEPAIAARASLAPPEQTRHGRPEAADPRQQKGARRTWRRAPFDDRGAVPAPRSADICDTWPVPSATSGVSLSSHPVNRGSTPAPQQRVDTSYIGDDESALRTWEFLCQAVTASRPRASPAPAGRVAARRGAPLRATRGAPSRGCRGPARRAGRMDRTPDYLYPRFMLECQK